METAAPKLSDVVNAPLRKTGIDIPEGSYPATLYGYSEPFFVPVPEQFRKDGGPDRQLRMEMQFGLKVKGTLCTASRLVNVPQAGQANARSNLYKHLKTLRPDLFDGEGNFKDGADLKAFIGATATIQVKKNKKDFPTVDGVLSPMEGVVCPTLEECKALVVDAAESEDVPF